MKILVTGKNGYIAKSFAEYVNGVGAIGDVSINADLLSLRGDDWRRISFEGYDAVLHTAGIAHKRETRHNLRDYFAINRDLSLEVAQKAKAHKVKHFVFLSTLSVYGLSTGTITADTPTKPTTYYGQSKLEAESMLASLSGSGFEVAILRVPMVYGKNCPGNYSRLCKLVKIMPIFPDYENARSLISIENLCEFLLDVIENKIENKKGGLFFPMDERPVSTTELALGIADELGKDLRLTRRFNFLIDFIKRFWGGGMVAKMFGDLVVEE